MKKLLLLGLAFGAFTPVSSQTIWSDDFEDEDVSDWTIVDADDDGLAWGDIFQVNNSSGNPVSPVSLISRSWQVIPLTPDNWAISPAIDLSNATGPITLTWKVQAAAASWNEENYTVYVATESSTAALEASTVTFTEVYPGDNTGPQLVRTLDVSSFAGQTIYVAFRHHDVTDMDWLSIDDVSVSTSLNTADFFRSNFAIYPNPAANLLNIASIKGATIQKAQVTDLNGRVVKEVAFDGISEAQINVSDLNAGVYFIGLQSESGSGTSKFVKN